MINFDSKIENWKNKLLDMSKRNRLLNFRDTASTNLRITYPSYEDLFESFVRQEKDLTFPMPLPEDLMDDEEDEEEIVGIIKPTKTKKTKADEYTGYGSSVRTNKKIKDLQKTLRHLRNKAKISIEEQGINTLYLCFGFLKWKEAEQSDTLYSAPLILVPVSLFLEAVTSPFVLKLHDDEMVVNPTLTYKMINEFGVSLPEFNDDDPLDDFFSKIRRMVRQYGWDVETDVALCLLSFLKINMYADLKNHSDTLKDNPVVRAICGDPTGLKNVPEGTSDYNFDRNDKPEDVFQILDADSSQQEAIMLAKKGVSFVLQGPPGTGKSQTITNIIAESLADGKKVLFVSEKMAALDVVHNRLTKAGLDDFCLVLHSHKANKRSVLDQLANVVQMSSQKAVLTDEVSLRLQELLEDRKWLNDYAEQVFTRVKPIEKTIYDVNGIIAALQEAPDLVFEFSDIRNVDKTTYQNLLFYLDKLGASITVMGDHYASNPWRNTNLQYVSQEFRFDVNARLKQLPEQLAEDESLMNDINESLFVSFPISLTGAASAQELLSAFTEQYDVPVSWVSDSGVPPIENDIQKCEKIQEHSQKIIQGIIYSYSLLEKEGISFEADEKGLLDLNIVEQEMKHLDSVLKEAPYCRFSEEKLAEISSLLSEAKSTSDKVKEIQDSLSSDYEEQIYDIDYEAIRNRIKTEYSSVFKGLKKDFKKDKKTFLLNSKQIRKKVKVDEMLSVVDKLKNRQGLLQWFKEHDAALVTFFGEDGLSYKMDFAAKEHDIQIYKELMGLKAAYNDLLTDNDALKTEETVLRNHFESLFDGMSTDWDAVKKAWIWSQKVRKAISGQPVSKKFVSEICSSAAFTAQCLAKGQKLAEISDQMNDSLTWFFDQFEDTTVFRVVPIFKLRQRIADCIDHLSYLEEWLDYRDIRDKCYSLGLEDYISRFEKMGLPGSDVVPVFKKRFFHLWLDAVLPEYPAVLKFRGVQQDKLRSDFASLDKKQFAIAKSRIKERLINQLPAMNQFTSGTDELSILKRELVKQRKIMPVRKLFSAIPNLLLSLKPCLMMSPLSVSLFLEADTYQFDIVIFDEASQVYTENAIGAISRGKQVIIAGDSKQLPPTSFFHSGSDEEFDDDDDDTDAYEIYDSVLDEAHALPERTLGWHYRSRHESLIAFSNAKIYHNMLTTFPSNMEADDQYGVRYVYVEDGFYDRGGRKGNYIEAKKVVDLVYEHFAKEPDRSLGVIAFGEVQQNAIELALNERRRISPEYEKFFDETIEEPFFVKSLENVQGDERDTIIFSIGYAKDAAGKSPSNFGPLGKAGGERRLNVAITRAKFNVILVGSIQPTDINTDTIKMDGPRLLRAYIEYAIKGVDSLAASIEAGDIVEYDSPFEESVYNFLDRKGYKLRTQVGCSGYRIDMAVRHPSLSGVYVLGIECDGASYHSARTARERDRLRQEVLENMGWKIYRIWSTDWIKDPVNEGKKLLTAVEKAIADYGMEEKTQQYVKPKIEKEEVFVELEAKNQIENDNPYNFEMRKMITPSELYTMFNVSWRTEDYIREIVKRSYPIHIELVCQLMAPFGGNDKATSKIRRMVDSGIYFLKNEVIKRDDFLYPAGYTSIPVYLPNDRKIQYISVDELSTAMWNIMKARVGFDRKGLIDETARVYGYARTGTNISSAMNNAIEYLISNGLIEEIDGKLRVK